MTKICFIGSGNMAEAIISGLLDSNFYDPAEILASDVNRERLSYLNLKFGIKTCLNDPSQISQSETVIFSVKPQLLSDAMNSLQGAFRPETFFLSILAGISIETIEKYLQQQNSQPKVARVMPNLGALVGRSVSAIAYNSFVSKQEKQLANHIFSSIGMVYECPESEINMITAVSGSGPAYIFFFMETFIEAAKELGMKEETAFEICMKTLEGSFHLLTQNKTNPRVLREKVTSKGGTTEAAINSLEQDGFPQIFKKAIKKALKRADELGS